MQQGKNYKEMQHNEGFVAFFIFLAAVAAIAYFFIFNKSNQGSNPNPDTEVENVGESEGAPMETVQKNRTEPESAPSVENQTISEKITPSPVTGPVYDVAGRVVVSYSKSGFSPFIAHVRLAKSIIFINESDSALWVAAVADPSTGVATYPEFDAGKSIGKGEVYIFTFMREGLFTYGNKNNKMYTGAVLVTAH